MNYKVKVSKKDKELLKSCKSIIEPPKDYLPNHNLYGIYFCLNKGELLALKNALDSYETPVARDVKQYLANALEQANINLNF
jgi:hypothetical protein